MLVTPRHCWVQVSLSALTKTQLLPTWTNDLDPTLTLMPATINAYSLLLQAPLPSLQKPLQGLDHCVIMMLNIYFPSWNVIPKCESNKKGETEHTSYNLRFADMPHSSDSPYIDVVYCFLPVVIQFLTFLSCNIRICSNAALNDA